LHSSIYQNWISNTSTSRRNVFDFISMNGSIHSFTKADIISFHENPFYKNLVDDYILVDYPDFLLKIFRTTELISYVETSESSKLKKSLFTFLLKDYTLYLDLLLELFLVSPMLISSFVFELDFLSIKDSRFCKFLNINSYVQYFLSHYEEFDNPLILNILNDYQKLQAVFENLSFSSSFFDILKSLEHSKHYSHLFSLYKNKLYAIFYQIPEESFQEYFVLSLILEDLLNLEQLKFSDLQFLTSGAFCSVFRFRNYVFKVGRLHSFFNIPPCSSVLYPMIRKQIKALNLYFEISCFCDTTNISLEDVYKLYKETRQNGVIWLDPKEQNVGRLLDFNYPFFVNPSTIGYLGNDIPLKKVKDLVIIDLDFLVLEKDYIFTELDTFIDMRQHLFYETRYQRELKK